MNIFIAGIHSNTATLTPEESWHCSKVLRKKSGDAIHLIDGNGNFYEAVLDLVTEKVCKATITSGPTVQVKRDYYLHLAIAPTKQMDRIEWMIEKCVEIGIDEISFIQCKNSERVVIKSERIQKIVESAVKQSLQAKIPVVNELKTFTQFIKENYSDQKLIAHCTDREKSDVRAIIFKNKNTSILIGPEGDFTNEEIQLAFENDFTGISLGENRLRTETAGLYVCQAAAILT